MGSCCGGCPSGVLSCAQIKGAVFLRTYNALYYKVFDPLSVGYMKIIKIFLIVYFSAGAIFASMGGYFTLRLMQQAGENTFYDDILSVNSVFLDERKYLNICIDVVLVDSLSKGKYTLSVAMEEHASQLKFEDNGDNISYVGDSHVAMSRKSINEGCSNYANSNSIPIVPIQMEFY